MNTLTIGRDDAATRQNFRPTLLRSLGYVSSWATAEMLWAVLNDEALLEAFEQGTDPDDLLRRVGGEDARVAEGLLEALRCEGILERGDGKWRLAASIEELRVMRGWFELFLEGYRPLFQNIGTLAREGAGSVSRNSLHVALGSAGMAAFDAVPLILRLIDRVGVEGRYVLDYGCGNAFYLTTLCSQDPELRAMGVEVAEETVISARKHIEECGMSDRISILHASAPDYLPEVDVDFVVFAFVLHEIVADRGVDGTVAFLRGVGERLPGAKILAIEVSNPFLEDRADVLAEHPQGRGYYNWYVWLHTVTHQRLLRAADWQEIFSKAGFRVICTEGVDPVVDPTGFEIGYALEYVG